MQIQTRIFIDGSREPLVAVGSRPVQVINAVLRIRAQKIPVISLSLAWSAATADCEWSCDPDWSIVVAND